MAEEETKKKRGTASWTRLKILAKEVLTRVIAHENSIRKAGHKALSEELHDAIIGRSKLGKLLNGLKDFELKVDFDRDYSNSGRVVVTAELEGADGEIYEELNLTSEERKALVKVTLLSSDDSALKSKAEVVASYVSVELDKNPDADVLDLLTKHVNEVVKSK